MAIESPLFQSAMELYGHTFSHFNNSEELDRKLVILHLANAVELILMERDKFSATPSGLRSKFAPHGWC